jgi:hypothetical protein
LPAPPFVTRLCCIAIVGALGAIGCEGAFARIKLQKEVACSFEQEHSPGGRECLKKHDEDLLNGVPSNKMHVLICVEGGRAFCCHEGAQGVTCVEALETSSGGVRPPGTAGVLETNPPLTSVPDVTAPSTGTADPTPPSTFDQQLHTAPGAGAGQ